MANNVYWDVTPCILVNCQREGKRIQAAPTSKKLVSIYQMSLLCIPRGSNPSNCPSRMSRNTEQHPIPCWFTAVSSVRDLTTVCLRFRIPSRLQPARWARKDSVVRRIACCQDKLNFEVSTGQNFVRIFMHDTCEWVYRKLCVLKSEWIYKTDIFLSSVKN